MTLFLTTPSGPVQFSSSVRVKVYCLALTSVPVIGFRRGTYRPNNPCIRAVDFVVRVDIVAGGPTGPVAGSVAACLTRQYRRFLSFFDGDKKVPLGSGGRGCGCSAGNQKAHGERQSTKEELHPQDTGKLPGARERIKVGSLSGNPVRPGKAENADWSTGQPAPFIDHRTIMS